ncbi:hypothetical protein SVIOM342S_08998 [Streptomyces violaceorubidus]
MTGLRYVYAVCRPFDAALQAQLTGVAGDPPRLLPHGGLVAVVSHVPEADFSEEALRAHLEDLDWLTATARAHQQVVDALTVVTTPPETRRGQRGRRGRGAGIMTVVERREIALVDLLDRLLAGGVVITGDVTLRIADVDLVRIDLNALISSVNRNVPSPFGD